METQRHILLGIAISLLIFGVAGLGAGYADDGFHLLILGVLFLVLSRLYSETYRKE